MNLNKPICLSLLLTTLTFAQAAPADDSELLKILARLVPAETIVITASEKEWKHQTEVLKEAAEFQTDGGKLLRLEFPQTEVQHFGDVAIIWSTYELETEVKGKRSSSGGRVTEIFVRRDGQWTNPGWHTSHPPGS